MRIVHYHYKNKKSYGAINEGLIVNLPSLAKHQGENLPDTIEDFIYAGENATQTAERLIVKAKTADTTPLNEVSLLAPIMFPPKIVCLGVNYRDHAAETGAEIPKEPVLFMKPHTAIIGPNEKVVKSFVKQLDYEGELAIIIGKKAKNISADEAKKHVFGYTILNDISAREIQFGDKQWTRGKSFDTFAPTGPCITTEGQLKDTSDLFIRTWVNNELRQNGTTMNMVFNVEQIMHRLSQVMTLQPCDIIATGTPAGVGMSMKPQKWLKNGDVIKIEIDGIGILENTVE